MFRDQLLRPNRPRRDLWRPSNQQLQDRRWKRGQARSRKRSDGQGAAHRRTHSVALREAYDRRRDDSNLEALLPWTGNTPATVHAALAGSETRPGSEGGRPAAGRLRQTDRTLSLSFLLTKALCLHYINS